MENRLFMMADFYGSFGCNGDFYGAIFVKMCRMRDVIVSGPT